jgi:predicted Zn-dependent peptidase
MTLKGPDSIVGRYADPADTDRLSLDAVRDFYHRRHQPGSSDIILSGHVDDALVALVDSHFGHDAPVAVSDRKQMDNTVMPDAVGHRADPFEAAQTSLRVGRLIPLAWNDPEFADLMLLTTLLGGYFGSRLMSNLREDKGFTYGIMARNQLYRGTAFFHISADVAAGTADRAEEEIARELQRLVDEPVPEEELELVKTVFVGDFLRSVDGIFERAERFSSMFVSGIDERFTDNLRHSLLHSTPETLHRVARRWLSPDAMLFCRAGN